MKYEFAYLTGSLFLAVIWVSFLTLLLGLTEPIFVPRYWVPPPGSTLSSARFCFSLLADRYESYL